MAKSTQHIDKLGSYDTFIAPWETEGGSDAEIDKPKLKRLIYNLKKDHATARDAHEDTKATLTEVEAERDTFKEQAADANGAEAQKTIDKLTKERDNLKAENEKLVADKAEADLRAEVLEGVDPKVAKYVKGTTKEELEESLAAVKEDFGISDDPADDDEDDEPKVRTRPVSKSLTNPADKGGKGAEVEYDFDKVADDIVGTSIF